jgi:anti-anti-sigma factor
MDTLSDFNFRFFVDKLIIHLNHSISRSSTLEDQKSLKYFFNERSQLLVVTLQGELSGRSAEILESCRKEILERKEAINRVVLSFQEVEHISLDVIPVFAQLQREIRSMPADLRLCALKSGVREKLIRMGVVRGREVADDLKAALLSLPKAA